MKLSTLIIICSVLCFATACGQNYSEDYYYQEQSYDESYGEEEYAQETAYQTNNQGSGGGGNLKMVAVKNPKTGLVSAYYPLPSGWKLGTQGINGPGGAVFNDAQGGQINGQASIDQVIQNRVMPMIRQGGGRYVSVVDLPEVARNDQRMYANYWQAMPCQNFHSAKGINIKDANGNPGFIVIHQTNTRSQYGSFGFYYMTVLGTTGGSLEKAKKEVIYALANMKQNPQAVALHNRKEQQKSQSSWAAHNSKMRTNQRNFQAHQNTMNTLSEVNDIYFDTWKNTSRMNDAGHQNSVNSVWERENRTNPYGGGQVTVESGYDKYYTNEYGEYIGTNDQFYNPNTDPNVNNQDWQEMESNDYNY